MNVPMVRKTTDENENVTEEDFTLSSLEVIGKINLEGLNLEVSQCSVAKMIYNISPPRHAAAT